jgi:hypothetical protein
MSDSEISKLLKELKQLKLQETRVLNALEDAHIRQTTTSPNRSLLSPPPTTVEPGEADLFIPGDRVIITNKVRKPLNRPTNNGDRTGVVTTVQQNRVNLKTSNGTQTWRAPHNLRHRRNDE